MHRSSLPGLPTPDPSGRIVPAFTPCPGRPVIDRDALKRALNVYIQSLTEDVKRVQRHDGRPWCMRGRRP